jgi:hypothetical protein
MIGRPLILGRRWLGLAAAGAALAACQGTLSEEAAISGGFGPVGDVRVPIASVEERRFATVIRQRYDFSCGSAALATLLRYHYGLGQDEEAAFRGMWAKGDRDQIRRLGFSLLDMKRYLAALGLDADGFEVTLHEVAKAGVPGIALVNLGGYRHFVVVKGVANGEVLVGDPALGLKPMKERDFKAAWNGVYFAVNSRLEKGRANFNRDAQWAQFARAPAGAGFTDPLSQQALMLTAPFYREF